MTDNTTIQIPRELHKALKLEAVKRDKSLTALLAEIVKAFLGKK